MNTGEINLLIGKIRKNKKVRQDVLAMGICSEQLISKIEKGKVTPEFFLSEVLMQRLGKTLDKMEIILSLDEYEEIEERDNIIDDLRRGRLEEAERRLKCFCVDAVAEKQPMREMNRCRLQGVLAYEKGDYAGAKEYLRYAASLSMGEIGQIDFESRLLADIELETLILYAQVQLALGERPEAWKLLEEVSAYVQKKVTDEEELVKFKPKIAVLLGDIYNQAGEYDRCIELCEEAMELLRNQGLVQCMTVLIRLLLEAYGMSGQPGRGKVLAVWKEILELVYKHFGLDVEMVNKLYFNCCISQYYLVGEIIREERKAQGMSQGQLIEGIYQNPETLSRIENGKMPDSKKLQMLFERLGIEKYRYTGMVITDEYSVLELDTEMGILLCRREYDKAMQKLEELKEKLDMSILENRQLVDCFAISQRYREKKISAGEVIRQAFELLRLTYHAKSERVPFGSEALLMNQICNHMTYMRRFDEAIAMQKQVINLYEKSRVNNRYHYRKIFLFIDNMSRSMEYIKYYEEAEYWSKYGITDYLLNGKGNKIHLLLGNLIGITEERNMKELCETYTKWTYYFTDIYKQYNDQKYCKKYVKEHFDTKFLLNP